jgi:molybdopterin/thiamine biosynthesis adenylyltransferase/rhodanese-related sulfurtransferase
MSHHYDGADAAVAVEEAEEEDPHDDAAADDPRRSSSTSSAPCSFVSDLQSHEIERYSRQLLMATTTTTTNDSSSSFSSTWGVVNQVAIQKATVLVVGAGGIGSTVIPYLAGAGVGMLRIVDDDVVETTNLHRQGILHRGEHIIGTSKAISAAAAVQSMNPHVIVEPVVGRVTPDTMDGYLWVDNDDTTKNTVVQPQKISCVVDCSDNPYTRYTLNDACYYHQIPLVSASAIADAAQLTVFGYGIGGDNDNENNRQGCCCYRCLFPYDARKAAGTAPAPNCNDHGVWGPVPGMIGTMAAMECLKVIGRFGQPLFHHVLSYEAGTAEFRRWKKPKTSRRSCSLCGTAPTLTNWRDTAENLHGLLSCGNHRAAAAADQDETERLPQVTVQEYDRCRHDPHWLLDVRNTAQFQLVHLPHAVHVPLLDLLRLPTTATTLQSSSSTLLSSLLSLLSSSSSPSLLRQAAAAAAAVSTTEQSQDDDNNDKKEVQQEQPLPIYVLCRRGVASAQAVRHLRQILPLDCRQRDEIYHITGGLDAWRSQVDPTFPKY